MFSMKCIKKYIKGAIPESFKFAILIQLLKNGDPNCPSNYWGLSLNDTLCKIFNNVNCITYWINKYNMLNEFQAEFKKEYATFYNVFNLINIVHLRRINGKNTYEIRYFINWQILDYLRK